MAKATRTKTPSAKVGSAKATPVKAAAPGGPQRAAARVRRVSVVIRTYNEIRYLPRLLETIRSQETPGLEVETIMVDSGSTDGTREEGERHGAREIFIAREEFSFGRSLNRGCEGATGEVLVFISGHCIPMDSHWLANLVRPVLDGRVAYSYGKQRGDGSTKYSERQLLKKYFGEDDKVPQEGFFINNANAALSKAVWNTFRFDEEVTGLEDMELAKRLVAAGHKVGYVASAGVFHYHHETWRKVKWRYEREALALQGIMPNVHVTRMDMLRYILSGTFLDWGVALQEGRLHNELMSIVKFRTMQYMGSYRGNHQHRKLSKAQKEHYFYPR